jgi:DNA-binding transcriptional MocR family regulator
MLKGEDMVLLMKLASHPDAIPTVRALEAETGIPRSVVQRALKRLALAGLLNDQRGRVNVAQTEEFLLHGLRYVFPAALEGETRGIPTAWAAEPLAQQISSPPGDLPPVWPDSQGLQRGLALQPLHPAAPTAARRDRDLAELLTLADALRLGDARIRGTAATMLADRLGRPVP